MIFSPFTANEKRLTDNLGFFFSCFKEEIAVRRCIENIRTHYPHNKIFLASDGGSDFTELQNESLKFKLYEDVLGYVNNPETKDKERLIDCCVEFLNRLKEAVDYCNSEYIMYYEPDVMLRDTVTVNSELQINGSFANSIDQFVLDFISKKNPHNVNRNFGSCGGSIIKVSSFIDVYTKTDRQLLKELIYLDPRISNCDYLLTVLFSIHGYRYDKNFDFVEARRDRNWQLTRCAIVHQYHQNYQVGYEGKYAISQ